MRAPAGAHLVDQLGVAGTVEDDDGEVADAPPASPWPPSAGSASASRVMSIAPTALGTDGDLLHVVRRAGVEHRAPLADGDHRQGVAAALGGERGAVDRVDGDVDQRAGCRRRRCSPLKSIGASSFSPSPMTTMPSIVHRRQDGAHRLDRGAVGAVLVAPPDPAGRRQGRRLGDPDQLHGQVAVGSFSRGHGRDGSQVHRGGADVRRRGAFGPTHPCAR